MKYIYGIDIGGTTIKMGLFAEDGTLKENGRLRQEQKIMERILFQISQQQ